MEPAVSEFPTPYPGLNEVLDVMVKRMDGILGNDFVGAYLQGSFAVGDFDQHSDVDFIIAVQDILTRPQVEILQQMHGEIFMLESHWAQHLEGSYFPISLLRGISLCGTNLWYLDNGASSLVESEHCNTIVVRTTLRKFGKTLAGPSPRALIDPISADLFRQEVADDILNWGQEILGDPDKFNNRFYQSFIILSYCRMLHDLLNGYPGSKRQGAEWAKVSLDQSWSGLIDRTWDARPKPEITSRQPADPADFASTMVFIRYMIEESKRIYSKDKSDL